MTDLTSLTPAEIDVLWAPIASREAKALSSVYELTHTLRQAKLGIERGFSGRYEAERAQRVVETLPAEIEKFQVQAAQALREQEPFKAEWNRRGGWTRAYLVVTNGQGHVHRTTSCSTCYPTTQFAWLTELSGADEQEIVDQAGERACTVCYASAPVALRLDRPTQLFSEKEKAQQAARDEKAAKRAAAVAAAVADPETGKVLFKTERGATNAIAADLFDLCWYGETHPSADEWKTEIDRIRRALAAKGAEYDYERALSAARKKTAREGRQAQF
jgi:hypothetical protein